MFFKKDLSREMSLHPRHFGPSLRATLKNKLLREVETTSLGADGYCICIVDIHDESLGKGRINNDSGCVHFDVKYSAILLRPFKNEVLDAEVTVVTQLGFFCQVGPLTIFVTRHAMPEDLCNGYNHDTQSWISDDNEVEVSAGCGVRLKILGVTVQAHDIKAIGTIKDDYLGLIAAADGGQWCVVDVLDSICSATVVDDVAFALPPTSVVSFPSQA